MKHRPCRNESPLRSAASTSSACPPRAQLVVRASLTPPSLSIWLLTFPEKDGVEHALLREADLPIFIPIVTKQANQTCPNRRRLPKGGTSRRPLISVELARASGVSTSLS